MPSAREAPPTRLLLGIGVCLVAYIFFVTASSLVWNFDENFPTVQILFIQNCISFFCILPLALRQGITNLKTNFFTDHFIRDIFGIGSYFFYFAAIRTLDLVDATTLNYTAPFFVPLIWWIWMKQKVGMDAWWSIVIGFIGVAVILNPTRQIFQLGFVFGLFAGITSGVAFCALRILNLHREPLTRTLFYYFAFGALSLFPFAWASWVPPTPAEWVRTIAIGIATAIAQILLTIAYRYGTASYLSPLGYASVLYAGFSSWFFFDVDLTWRSLIGALLIIGGGTATYIFKKRPETIRETFQTPDPKEKPPL
ncbi:MAG: DMT family transporter [Chlamydiae bacterium]|nr:DMT family transporter [Chlamydiota bacterium]